MTAYNPLPHFLRRYRAIQKNIDVAIDKNTPKLLQNHRDSFASMVENFGELLNYAASVRFHGKGVTIFGWTQTEHLLGRLAKNYPTNKCTFDDLFALVDVQDYGNGHVTFTVRNEEGYTV